MELFEIKKRLEKLNSDKLTDVVKNYRQYGYTEEIRNYALLLLEQRGITKSDLQLTGNFDNANYDYADYVFKSFRKNSRLAFVFYSIFLVSRFLVPILFNSLNNSTTLVIILYLSLVLYLIFLILSFLDQSKFYKLVGDDYGTEGALIYLIAGMPLYIIMYFIFQRQMNERLKLTT